MYQSHCHWAIRWLYLVCAPLASDFTVALILQLTAGGICLWDMVLIICWPHSPHPRHLRNKHKGWKLILQGENGGVFASDFTIPVLTKGGGKKAAMSLMAAIHKSQGVSPNSVGVQDWTLHQTQQLCSDQGPEARTLPSLTCLENPCFRSEH